MKKIPDPFKGKHVLVFGSGADCITAASWLLDREVQVTITDRAGIRGIQGHLRATAEDGSEYERRKDNLSWVAPEEVGTVLAQADLVVTKSAPAHPAVRQARELGIPVVSRGGLAKAFPLPPRHEIVYRSAKMSIINDTGAVSPERAAISVRQWGGPNCILIAGGDGRRTDYRAWADTVAEHIRPTNLILLTGSATGAMRTSLGARARGVRTYDSLERCWGAALDRARKYIQAVILFSPGAKSFELFANEFDRGQKFNGLVTDEFGR
jgi:UDP-N-acetylmuramoylalanine-D-glutamate ligase